MGVGEHHRRRRGGLKGPREVEGVPGAACRGGPAAHRLPPTLPLFHRRRGAKEVAALVCQLSDVADGLAKTMHRHMAKEEAEVRLCSCVPLRFND